MKKNKKFFYLELDVEKFKIDKNLFFFIISATFWVWRFLEGVFYYNR